MTTAVRDGTDPKKKKRGDVPPLSSQHVAAMIGQGREGKKRNVFTSPGCRTNSPLNREEREGWSFFYTVYVGASYAGRKEGGGREEENSKSRITVLCYDAAGRC